MADWDVEAKHPDNFLIDQFHLDAVSVHKSIQAAADSWQKPKGTVNEILDSLDRAGTPSDCGSPTPIAERIRESR